MGLVITLPCLEALRCCVNECHILRAWLVCYRLSCIYSDKTAMWEVVVGW